jgi:polyisoprenoid-binding protein YceI
MNRFLIGFFCIFSLTTGLAAEAAKYSFSQSGSSLKFLNKASLHGIEGKAKAFSGTLDTDALTGVLTVETAEMTTSLGPRDTKMHKFCLESKKFPKISFSVTGIEGGEALQAGSGSGKVTLVGKLTIRDVSLPVRVVADFSFTGADLSLKGRYDFKWTDFNVPDPSIFVSTLYPEMNVQFQLAMTSG